MDIWKCEASNQFVNVLKNVMLMFDMFAFFLRNPGLKIAQLSHSAWQYRPEILVICSTRLGQRIDDLEQVRVRERGSGWSLGFDGFDEYSV